MGVWIGTCINEAYVSQATRFLQSLQDNMPNVRRFCVCYGFRASSSLAQQYPDIDFRHLPSDIPKADCHGCIQHGPWVHALDVADDDLLILSDADVEVQRPFSFEEVGRFNEYGHRTFGLAQNADRDDTLLREYHRLKATVPLEVVQSQFGDLSVKCFNGGLMVSRVSGWRALCEAFEESWPMFSPLFQNRAKSQFLICWILANMGFSIDELPLSIHAHGHFGLPSGCRMENFDKLYYVDILTVFKHHFPTADVLKRMYGQPSLA